MNAYPTAGPAVMKLSEVAEVLAIGKRTAYEMAQGPLKHLVVRVGQGQTGIRIKRAEFYSWLDSQGSDKKGR